MKSKSSKGFTIIEALIVLAIVASILLIVFEVIPIARRTARNTARRRDAAFIMSQRVQYNMDNLTATRLAGFTCSVPTPPSEIFCTYLQDGLAYYKLEDVTFHNSGFTPPTVVPTVTDVTKILTDTYLKCNAANNGAEVAQYRNFMVVLFAVETSSGPAQQCIESSVFPSSDN